MTIIHPHFSVDYTGTKSQQSKPSAGGTAGDLFEQILAAQKKALESRFRLPPDDSTDSKGAAVDTQAKIDDPAYKLLQKTKQAQTMFHAQQMTEKTAKQSDSTDSSDPAQAFLNYMEQSPRERYFDKILKGMGLTREDLKAMSPQERAKVMRQIEAEIEKRMKNNTAEAA